MPKKVLRFFIAISLLLTATFVSAPFAQRAYAQNQIDIWWPANGISVRGLQPFKALVENTPLSAYSMYWQVDSGQMNIMYDNYTDYPHKETTVDFTNWNWKGSGPYALIFTAKSSTGTIIATKQISVYTAGTASPSPLPTPTPTPTAAPVSFYVDPNSSVMKQYRAWQFTQPADAQELLKIASRPLAKWLGGWNTDIQKDTDSYVSAAYALKQIPVFVAYNIPGRDCGGYSGGGAQTSAAYTSWIDALAYGINHRPAVIVLEPDSLANIDCLTASDKDTRFALLSYAVNKLTGYGASVYLDAGNPGWIGVSDMASRLTKAGIAQAKGFSLNVSNYITTADNITYGTQLSRVLGNKHFVIDTGRNGLGPTADFQWCNPPGRALGVPPTSVTGNPLADAYLWIKTPGESDGTCNGGPSAGTWWPDYALGLAERAAF